MKEHGRMNTTQGDLIDTTIIKRKNNKKKNKTL